MKPSERLDVISKELNRFGSPFQWEVTIKQYFDELDDKYEKLHSATKRALEYFEATGRREDIQSYLREALE